MIQDESKTKEKKEYEGNCRIAENTYILLMVLLLRVTHILINVKHCGLPDSSHHIKKEKKKKQICNG